MCNLVQHWVRAQQVMECDSSTSSLSFHIKTPFYLVLIKPASAAPLMGLTCLITGCVYLCQHRNTTQLYVCSPQSSDYWFSTTNIPEPMLWVLCFLTLKPPCESTSSTVYLLIPTKRRKHCTKQDCKYRKTALESRHRWALFSVRIEMEETFSAPSLLFFFPSDFHTSTPSNIWMVASVVHCPLQQWYNQT